MYLLTTCTSMSIVEVICSEYLEDPGEERLIVTHLLHTLDVRSNRLMYLLTMWTCMSIVGVKCSGYLEDPGEETDSLNDIYYPGGHIT